MSLKAISLAFPIAAGLIGFVAAIPIGPVNLEIVRRVLNRRIFSAMIFAAGAAIGDGLWPVIAFLGFSPLLDIRWVAALFWGFASLLLLFLGMSFMRDARAPHHAAALPAFLLKRRWALIGGLLLVITNPTALVTWITLMGIFDHLGMLPNTSYSAASALGFSVFAGSIAYFTALIVIVNRHHHLLIEPTRMRRIKTFFGAIVLATGAYFCWNFLRLFVF